MNFDPQYVDNVLSENFEDAKSLFLSPLMAIHHAHLVMLADRGIVTPADARTLRGALDSISMADVRATPYDGRSEDLFFHVEQLIVEACGEEAAGRLHTARSRNDIDMTMYRLLQREFILSLVEATFDLRDSLIALADRHRETLLAALTHTQPAQPTTIAHYMLGAIEQLERDAGRLRAAFSTTNRCPLGACAITGTGFAIDRQLTSDLLGFDGPTGNTYGSIATVDYLLESVSAAAVMLTGLGRFVQDLLLWGTAEFGYLRLADGFVQSSSIMPQKRNPVALEHARAIGSKAVGQAGAIVIAVHNTPFGDVVDTEDDLQPLVASMFRDARRAVVLVAAARIGASGSSGFSECVLSRRAAIPCAIRNGMSCSRTRWSASSVSVVPPSAALDASLATSNWAPRIAAATSVTARSASRNIKATSGCRSSSVSTMSPNGVLCTASVIPEACPSALLPIARACSSATGFRFWGMMLLPCTNPSASRR